jgi:thioredoxin-like negative regulator of GroEL
MSQGASQWRLKSLLALAITGLIWGGWKWSEVWHYHKTLARIEDAMEKGLQSLAAKDLVELLGRNPDSDEVAFLLGTCEKARGRSQAAADAWAKIPPQSTFAFHAMEGRVQLEFEQGRLTEAEYLITSSRENPGSTSPDPSILLGPIYCQEGRVSDAMHLIEALWRRHNESGNAASETAINQLRLYIQLQLTPISDETIRATLDRAGRIAPEDDRIWLWKAELATRTKSYEEAARLIDLCLKRRPEDLAVWHARLDWAVATNRVPLAQQALKHLPEAELGSAKIERLAAWFAAQHGDDEAERRNLERLIAVDPTDFTALDRLIELLVKSGRIDLAAEQRRRKDEIAQLQARYRELFARNQPRRDAAEMGRLAEQLGRRFEAKAFLTIALASTPDRADIRRDLVRLAKSANTLVESAATPQ